MTAGLVVTVSAGDGERYRGSVPYDVAKAAVNRLAYAFAQDFAEHGVTAVALSPGWLRTERVLEHGVDETDLDRTESVEYVGRAVAALAAWRWRHDDVGPGYLLAGGAAFGLMAYSAWLGGEMVYSHGIGVKEAGKVRDDVPELSADGAGRATARAARDAVSGAGTAIEETAEGEVAPGLRGGEH